MEKKGFLIILILVISMPAFAGMSDWLFGFFQRHKGVDPIYNELYVENCGECHFAYQPGLLLRRSWVKLMSVEGLEDHFGDNAELDEEDRLSILVFLEKNAADDSFYKRSIKIRRSTKSSEAPLRITQSRYIKRKHAEISDQYIKDNKDVLSLINCDACHKEIEKGIYDDDSVLIPNFGEWDE